MRAALALLLCLAAPAPAAACALALAFALDVSSSVNAQEYEIQKGGLADALRDPDIRAAALSPPGSVWLTAYEWSGWRQQSPIVRWTRVDEEADLDRFAATLDAHERRYAKFSTAIGAALEYGVDLFGALPAPCARHVIDISGDGVSNDGFPPDALRPTGVLDGLTVNALVIKGATPDPEAYYRDNVIWGPDRFLIVARNGFEDYADLIKGKIRRELSPTVILGAAR